MLRGIKGDLLKGNHENVRIQIILSFVKTKGRRILKGNMNMKNL